MCNQCPSPLTLWVGILLRRGVLDITLCGKVGQWLAKGRSFSPTSSVNKIDRHDITEILLRVALNTITLTLTRISYFNRIRMNRKPVLYLHVWTVIPFCQLLMGQVYFLMDFIWFFWKKMLFVYYLTLKWGNAFLLAKSWSPNVIEHKSWPQRCKKPIIFVACQNIFLALGKHRFPLNVKWSLF
jgi:hypothetical protein